MSALFGVHSAAFFLSLWKADKWPLAGVGRSHILYISTCMRVREVTNACSQILVTVSPHLDANPCKHDVPRYSPNRPIRSQYLHEISSILSNPDPVFHDHETFNVANSK